MNKNKAYRLLKFLLCLILSSSSPAKLMADEPGTSWQERLASPLTTGELLNGVFAFDDQREQFLDLFLDAGGDINVVLETAARDGKIKIVKFLIEKGCEIKESSDELLRICIDNIRYSASEGHKKLIEFLLSHGADPSLEESIVLVNAAIDRELFDLLVLHGADPKQRIDAIFRNFVKDHSWPGFRNNFDTDFFDYLISFGADSSINESSILIEAATNQNMFNLLITHGADPHIRAHEIFCRFIEKHSWREGLSSEQIEIFNYLIELGADPTHNESLALTLVGKNVELFERLVKVGAQPEKQANEIFFSAVEHGNVDLVRKMLVDFKVDPNFQGCRALLVLYSKITEGDYDGHSQPIKQLLLEHGGNTEIFKIAEAIDAEGITPLLELKKQGIHMPSLVVLRLLLKSNDLEKVRYAFKHFPELENSMLVGVSNERDRWSPNVLTYLEDNLKNDKDAFLMFISKEISADESILSRLSGFINPGAGDSYPRNNQEFTFSDMDEAKWVDTEIIYQRIINIALKYDIPYLGICAGAQTLVLKQKGTLERVKYHDSRNVDIKVKAGTVPHFMGLMPEEKVTALKDCLLEDYTIKDAWVAHSYAAVEGKLGKDIILAGKSEFDVPEAYSLGVNKIGVQFHPEDEYGYGLDRSNRQQELIQTFFAFIEGRHKVIQSAKAQGLPEPKVLKIYGAMNDALLERLQECMAGNTTSEVHFWGNRLGNMNLYSDQKDILILPGTLSQDLAFYKDKEDLVIYNKDFESELKIQSYFNETTFDKIQHLKFNDGSEFTFSNRNGHKYNKNTDYNLDPINN